MMLRPVHLLLAVALMATGLNAQAASAFTGCYSVTMGGWSGPFPSGSSEYHQPPRAFRLDTASISIDGYHRVEPNIARLGNRMQPGWRVSAPDSVHVFWSSGFAGVDLKLVARGDTLKGIARAFHDVIGPVQPTAPVVAVRIACGGTSP